MPRKIILGFRFMDRHLNYRKIDRHDQHPKIYKTDGERSGLSDVDSPGECEGESIYIVQIKDKEGAEQEKAKPIARITQLLNQVIDNQRIKEYSLWFDETILPWERYRIHWWLPRLFSRLW